MQAICFYGAVTGFASVARDMSLGVFGGQIHAGINEGFRKLEFNVRTGWGDTAFTLGGGNFDQLLKSFDPTTVDVRRQYAFDGMYFLFIRQRTGVDATDTVHVYVWDSVCAVPDDLTTFTVGGDVPMIVGSADDFLYMVCWTGNVYYRGRGLPPKTWTLVPGSPVVPGIGVILQNIQHSHTVGLGMELDGQNAGAGHIGKFFYTDDGAYESVSPFPSQAATIRSVTPAGFTTERTLPIGAWCRVLVGIPRVGLVYIWRDFDAAGAIWDSPFGPSGSPTAGHLLVGFRDYMTGTWTDIKKDLTAQDPTWTTTLAPMGAAFYRNRVVFGTFDGKIYMSPPVTIGDSSWITGTWTRFADQNLQGRQIRNMVAA